MSLAWPLAWRGPAGLTFRQCLRSAAIPSIIAMAIAMAAHQASQANLAAHTSAAAATPWLTLPLFVMAMACCLSAAHTWPTFAQGRSGADTIRRLERGPLGGRAAVVLGSLVAQLLLSVSATMVLSYWFDAPAQASHHYTAVGPAYPALSHPGESLTFQLAGSPQIESLWLRPRAGLPTGPGATNVTVSSKGRLLATTPIAFSESGALVRVAISSQKIGAVELTQTKGGVPLFFGEASVTAVGPANRPTWQNVLIAAGIATWTSVITLIIAAIIGLGAAWPTLAATICCAQFVQWIGGIGPIDEALLGLLRGRWLL